MPGEEIPREHWITFFDDFSERHQSWIVVIEALQRELGDQQAASLPLVGITADLKDGESRIEIICGEVPGAHFTHTINGPERVLVKPAVTSADEALEIKSDDGTSTLVQFQRVPVGQTERQLPQRR